LGKSIDFNRFRKIFGVQISRKYLYSVNIYYSNSAPTSTNKKAISITDGFDKYDLLF